MNLLQYFYMALVWIYIIVRITHYIKSKLHKNSSVDKINKLISLVVDKENIFKLTSNEVKRFPETIKMANDSVLIKLLFQYPTILMVIRDENISDDLNRLYLIGETHTETIREAIIGLMALRARLKCYEESSFETPSIDPHVYDLPENKVELFKRLFILNKLCVKYKIDNEVFGEVSTVDFLYRLTVDLRLCKDKEGHLLRWD